MINHAAVVEWIGLSKTTEKKNGVFCVSFLLTSFLYLLSKLCIKNVNLDHHIRIHFVFFSAATLKDANIVKSIRIAFYWYCLLTTRVID